MRIQKLLVLFLVFGQFSFAQTILVEKTIYNSTKPIYLHSVNDDLNEVYFSSPNTNSLLYYSIKEDKVVEDKTIQASKFVGFVKMNEVYSLVQYENRIDVKNALNKNERNTLIHPNDNYNVTSITYDNESGKYFTLSDGQVVMMEINETGILRADTIEITADLPGNPYRISSYNGKPFLSINNGLDLSDIYMVDSLKGERLRYPINYNAKNIAIEFLNDDTLFVSRNLRLGENELVMIYASNISQSQDILTLDKINKRRQEQIDSIKAEAMVNAMEFTDTVTRDVGKGRFSTLIKRTNDAIVAMATLNAALENNPRSFISQKDSIFFVLGPKHTQPHEAELDSLYFSNSGITATMIDLGRDSAIVPEDVVIRLKCLDKATGDYVPFNVDYYDYESNTLMKSAKIQKGEVCYFSYLPKYNLGLTITSEGYLPHSIRFDNKKRLIQMKQVEKLVMLRKYEEGADNSFTLNNIYFDFGKWNISSVATRELEIIKPMVDNAKSVTIVGHTDAIGSDSFNQELSVKRAKEVRGFLEKKGVKKGFVKVVGMGEKEPVTSNKTEAGRAQNRRCEFIIR